MINRIVDEIQLMVGPVRCQIHPVAIFPVPEYIIGLDIFRSCHDSYIGSQTCEIRSIIIGKV